MIRKGEGAGGFGVDDTYDMSGRGRRGTGGEYISPCLLKYWVTPYHFYSVPGEKALIIFFLYFSRSSMPYNCGAPHF